VALYLYEFLYRGQPADHPGAPAYHVILADAAKDAFDRDHVNVGPAMTPEQAAAKGFALPDIIATINAGTMAENASLKSAKDDLQSRYDKLATDHAELKRSAAIAPKTA
jgi:hypothetical protein